MKKTPQDRSFRNERSSCSAQVIETTDPDKQKVSSFLKTKATIKRSITLGMMMRGSAKKTSNGNDLQHHINIDASMSSTMVADIKKVSG